MSRPSCGGHARATPCSPCSPEAILERREAAAQTATVTGAEAHARALEALYATAPINGLFRSRLQVTGPGEAAIDFEVVSEWSHAAGAAHGAAYFKMLDDAAFYAANSLVTDRFLLTTQFNLHFSRPMGPGRARAEGKWVSGRRRVFVAEARLIGPDGEEAARGTGTFARSRIPLSTLPGYRA